MSAISTQTDLGRKVQNLVHNVVRRQFDRRRVTGLRDDGRAETVSYDPELVGGQPVPMAVPLGMAVRVGDDVIALRIGGGWVIGWVVGTDEPESHAEIDRIVPFGGTRTGTQSIGILGSYQPYHTLDLDLSPGTYRFQAMGHGIVSNDNNLGGLAMRLAIGSEFGETGISNATLSVNQRTPMALHSEAELSLTSDSTVPVELAFATTALQSGGQAHMHHGTISGFYQRIR